MDVLVHMSVVDKETIDDHVVNSTRTHLFAMWHREASETEPRHAHFKGLALHPKAIPAKLKPLPSKKARSPRPHVFVCLLFAFVLVQVPVLTHNSTLPFVQANQRSSKEGSFP